MIPARNAESCLSACLTALQQQTVSAAEVIVVDDGSSDLTGEIALRAGARVIRQRPLGPAAARNRGVRAASCSVILFTDADCRPSRDWIDTMLHVFDDPTIDGCCGTYSSRQRALVARFVQMEFEDRYRRTSRWPTIDFVDTYSAGYTKAALIALGGFDERLRTSSVEDQELSFRAAARGFRMTFVPTAVVEHAHPSTALSYFAKKFKIGYYKPTAHRNHARRLLHDSHTPPSVRVEAALGSLLALCSAGFVFSRLARRLVIPLTAALLISGARLAIRNMRQDAAVGAISLPLIAVRAVALGGGLLVGCVVVVLCELRCLASRLSTGLLGFMDKQARQRVQEEPTPEANREQRSKEDHGVNALPALLGEVDVGQVKPQRKLV